MKYRITLRHAFLIVATMVTAHVHATTTDYTLKYNTWELIAVPNPLPSVVDTPMKMFGERIAAELPMAEYGLNADWVMLSYNSEVEDYEVIEKDTVFDPSKGYWAIQVASTADITLKVDGIDAELPTYSPGDIGPAGGFVFYVTDDGLHGYEAAPEDTDVFEFGCYGSAVKGAQSNHMGSGRRNTDSIISQCGIRTAAFKADIYSHNGYNDWYLPSAIELVTMYDVLHLSGQGGFSSSQYLSSSEGDGSKDAGFTTALHVSFVDGSFVEAIKDLNYRVRAIRSF